MLAQLQNYLQRNRVNPLIETGSCCFTRSIEPSFETFCSLTHCNPARSLVVIALVS